MRNPVPALIILYLLVSLPLQGVVVNRVHVFEIHEVVLTAEQQYKNPYTEVACWVRLQGPGFDKKIYGFWDGGQTFRVRLVANSPGRWTWESGSDSPGDSGLNGRRGEFEAVRWTEQEVLENPNRRGFIRATSNGHALEYADGTPFFFIGDTWWSASTWRYPLSGTDPDENWEPGPEGHSLENLVHYRKKQGYNSLGLIACFPNWSADGMPPRVVDENGIGIRQAWEKFGKGTAKDMHDESGNLPFTGSGNPPMADYERINPAYFRSLDRKMDYFDSVGFVPMLETVRRDHGPSWKAYFDWPGSFVRYVQYIVARYGAYNIIFSPIHLDWIIPTFSLTGDEFNEALIPWHETYGSLPYGQPVTALINPATHTIFGTGDQVPWLNMHSVGNDPRNNGFFPMLEEQFLIDPPMPAANLEPYYPGWKTEVDGETVERNSERDNYFARTQAWGSVLSGGLAGHMYGTGAYDGTTVGEEEGERPLIWDALKYPAGRQTGYLRWFIESEGAAYIDLVPASGDLEPDKSSYSLPDWGHDGWARMMRTPDRKLAMLYFQNLSVIPKITGLLPEIAYQLEWFDPVTGEWGEPLSLKSDTSGRIHPGHFPDGDTLSSRDWGLKIKLVHPPDAAGQYAAIYADNEIPQVRVAVDEISMTLGENGTLEIMALEDIDVESRGLTVVFSSLDDRKVGRWMSKAGCRVPVDIRPEGFSIRRAAGPESDLIWIVAADPAGLLYGGFELAEQIRQRGPENIRETDQNPHMAMRGMKFNIPLDVRTPTYSDPGEAAQVNIPVMWDPEFWKEFIDRMARYRYNFISLWNLHPFPSMVRVPEYPDIALDDVMRSTGYEEKIYYLGARGFDSPDIMEESETVKVMSIDEKIAHWRSVMAYAKERNIDFYIVTWNIHDYGTFGKYGITDDIDNPITRDYFRKSVRQMFLTYPDLAGIGLTTGENIPGSTFSEKEEWAFETYGKGVLDAAREQPGRKITLIHRQHEAEVEEIAGTFQPLIDNEDINFVFSFKYAQAHSYSSIDQPFKDGFIQALEGPDDLKTIWTLRNDDNYYFRWGAPGFVREFIRNIPEEVSTGYYFGSDGYVWGTDFLSRYPAGEGQIDIKKHWYSWMLWGRLGYNPDMGNDVLLGMLKEAYPETDEMILFAALQHASMTYPLTTGFHWGALDFQWYIEACQSRNLEAGTSSGFHDLSSFIRHGVHPGTDNIPIPKYVDTQMEGKHLEGTTPYQVSEALHHHADSALLLLGSLRCNGDFELWQQMEDIRAMALLGKYYGHKIVAATELAFYRKTHDPSRHEKCLDHLAKSAYYWRCYGTTAGSMYRNPAWFNRVGVVDWRMTYFDVLYELTALGAGKGIPSMEPATGGTILEAESARTTIPDRSDRMEGHTGTGYLEYSDYNDGDRYVEWEYTTGEEGIYLLDIRYINQLSPQVVQSRIYLDDEFAGNMVLWGTGFRDSWYDDRIYLRLKSGSNKIRFHPDGRFLIDHLRIMPLKEL